MTRQFRIVQMSDGSFMVQEKFWVFGWRNYSGTTYSTLENARSSIAYIRKAHAKRTIVKVIE